jgi:hypothetical protein
VNPSSGGSRIDLSALIGLLSPVFSGPGRPYRDDRVPCEALRG